MSNVKSTSRNSAFLGGTVSNRRGKSYESIYLNSCKEKPQKFEGFDIFEGNTLQKYWVWTRENDTDLTVHWKLRLEDDFKTTYITAPRPVFIRVCEYFDTPNSRYRPEKNLQSHLELQDLSWEGCGNVNAYDLSNINMTYTTFTLPKNMLSVPLF